MKKWFVRLPIYADILATVKADTPTDAIEEAYRVASRGVCHHCANHIELGEYDGSGEPTAEEAE